MMKIPLSEGKSLGFDRPMVHFSLQYSSLIPLPFSAIVDTGCPFTFLSKDALIGKRIPHGSKEIEKSPLGFGNFLLRLYELGDCKLFFKDIDNKLIKFEHLVHTGAIGVRGVVLSTKIPCFIGDDFLKKNKLSIIYEEDKRYLIKL